MSDQPPEPLSQAGVKEPKPITSKPFTYKMPKYLQYALRVEAVVLIASLVAYLLLQYFGATYRFDKNSAADFVKVTESVLKNHKSVTVKGLDTVRSEMAKALSTNNYQTARVEYFFNESDNGGFINALDTAAVGKLINGIKLAPEIAFHQKYSLVSSVKAKTGDDPFVKFNLNQFITTNGFWNNLEDDPLKYFCLVTSVILLVTMCVAYYDLQRQHKRYDRAIQFQRAYNASADVSESWITAQTMLDAYHQRNLNQNNWTFRLSVIVMAIGCIIIFYGIEKAVGLNAHATVKGVNDGTSLIAILSTASGVIVNLIGGTFLAIYNSTLKQAIDYTNSLQKTSTVGTSLAILKSIEVAQERAGTPDPTTTAALIDAKIAIAKQLIGVSGP